MRTSRSYHLYFIAPDGDEFEPATESEDDIDGSTQTVHGAGRMGWCVAVCQALFSRITVKHGPEIVCDRDSMFVTRTLQQHSDHTALPVEIDERHSENAMPAGNVAPISNPLPGAAEKRQYGFVPP